MELVKIVESKYDATKKFILKNKDGYILEFSYINKDDGKDIICLPCQTMCNVGCKFCHTTDYIGKIPALNVSADDMRDGLSIVYEQMKLKSNGRVLLISFMGCGEPLYNHKNIMLVMYQLTRNASSYGFDAPLIRFAVATSLPQDAWLNFFQMTSEIATHKYPVKVHLSLHYTIDLIRKEWMPKSLDIIPALAAMDFYKKLSKNAVEIHYTLIDGINDTEQDAILLSTFLKDRDINIKFLFYNEKPTLDAHASNKEKLNIFRRHLDKYGISHEYYVPPGRDIGSSCGAFLMDYYIQSSTSV